MNVYFLIRLLRCFMDVGMAGWHKVMSKAQRHQGYRERERAIIPIL